MATTGYLCVERADQCRECFHLASPPITLGSAAKSLIVLADQQLAPVHVEIAKSDDEVYSIKDLSGRGDVFVNDVESASRILSHGDDIRFGQAKFRFEQSDIAATDETADGRYGLLSDISQLASQASETYSLLHEALKKIHSSIQPDRSCVFLFDRFSEKLEIVSSISLGGLSQISRDLLAPITETGKPVRGNDKTRGETFQAIGVPMICQGQLKGGIYFEIAKPKSISPAAWSQQTVDLLTSVASPLALAIENQANAAQLGMNQPLYDVGSAFTSLDHQIMNIWQGFRGGAFVLQEGLTHQNSELARQGLEIIERDQNRLFDLIEDVLSFNTKHEFQLTFEDLRKIVTTVVNESRASGNPENVMIRWLAPEHIENALVDTKLIAKVIRSLIQNAIEACQEVTEPEITIQLTHLAEQQVFEISVTDNGCGIAEERIPLLKLPFETTKPGRKTGIGLAFAQKCVEKHEGEIRVESQVGKGSKFTLVLPDKNKLSPSTIKFGRAPKNHACDETD